MKQGEGVGRDRIGRGRDDGASCRSDRGWGRAFVAGRLGKGVLSEGPR